MYFPNFELKNILTHIESLQITEKEGLFFMITEHTLFDYNQLSEALNSKNYHFFGGIFPAILHGAKKFEQGIIIKKVSIANAPIIVKGLDGEQFNFDAINKVSSPFKSILILVDGLTTNISSFLSEMFNHLGNSINYIGGGCGSLTLEQKPTVFNNEGIFQDAALLVCLSQSISLGVRHGWETIQGPFVASSSQKNILQELNWQSAFEIYQSVIQADSGEEIGIDNFFNIAKGYPLGIVKEDEEQIVRDPIATNEKGELICVGEVPENAVLSILKGKPENLINAAKRATKDAIDTISQPPTDVLVIDCISRVLYLEEDFEEELDNINKSIKSCNSELHIEGALTLGEIASDRGYIEFYNKTVVVGLVHEI